jgi:branched-subunit amino acid ABC-type transport system permease component
MDYFAQQLINGLVLGSIYGLIAIGYTMVYGIVGMINFAHGDIFMIGGFIALISFLILVSIGLTVVPVILLIVLLVSMAITALYGWTVERIASPRSYCWRSSAGWCRGPGSAATCAPVSRTRPWPHCSGSMSIAPSR